MKLVYLAGPMSKGPQFEHVREACRQLSLLIGAGIAPIAPQLHFFADLVYPHSYDAWLAIDFEIIKRCDVLIRIPGESSGADREVEWARKWDIPVFFGTADEYLARGGKT